MRFINLCALFVLFSVSGLSVSQASPQDNFERRLELSQKMHEYLPARDQVYAAIDKVAAAQPPAQRETFRSAMRRALNYKAIEKISIDAMVETYSIEELEAMVEYYSKPEARSASQKTSEYSAKVYPEIIRMLDQAMMRVRTGGQ